MLAEEDRGPAWLADYGTTDFGNIEADIQAMEEFAKKLRSDVENNYLPHLHGVTDAMMTKLPPPAATFPELVGIMQDHQKAQDITQRNVYNFGNGTNRFATAAQKISKEYEGSDAFSRARVGDVRDAFKASNSPEGSLDA